jgi:hypothetical protein
MADAVGQASLRAENISAIVTGFALQAYKMKQVCMVNPSSSWLESYYKETKTELTGGLGSAVKGVPRLANFPYGAPTWTKATAYLEKYGMEGVVSYEDERTNNIDVIARTLLRLGRAVANAVDTQIYTGLSGASGINTQATGAAWDTPTVANRDPIQDILNAKKLISIDNYDIDDGTGYLLLSPTDYANLLGNSKVINNPTFKTADVVSNGVVAQVCGLKIIVSNVVTADEAIVIKAKEACTWKEAVALTVETINDPGIKKTIRAWEIGVLQVTNPEAICKITNTQT